MNILKFHLPTFFLWFVLTISLRGIQKFWWTFYLTYILAYYLTFNFNLLSGIYSDIRSHMNCDISSAICSDICMYIHVYTCMFQQICGHFSWHCDMIFYRAGPRAASWHWCKAVAGDHGRLTKETSQTNFGTALSKGDVNISDRHRNQGHSASFWVQRNQNWLKTTISIHFSDHLRSKQLAWRRAELASQASNPTRNGRCPAGRREWDAVSTWSGCGNHRWWSRDDPWSCRGWGWANC